MERARGVLSLADTVADPFKELKDRLVELLPPSELNQFTSILWGAELSGRRPQSSWRSCWPLCCRENSMASSSRLQYFPTPPPWGPQIHGGCPIQQLEAMELAKFPDIIWDARNSKKAVVVVVRLSS